MLHNSFPRPQPPVLVGTHVRIEPLSAATHADDLFVAGHVPDRDQKYRYLADAPPDDPAIIRDWAARAEASTDPMFLATIDRATNRAVGRQALMRIDATHGVIEVGHIYWGPAMARSARATEVIYLLMRHVFEDLVTVASNGNATT
jgi:RimJ/RimL family protein N-acetyltransferase